MWGPREIENAFRWGSHKSNVTMVYCTQITTVFMGFINQRSNHWGAPRCIYHVLIITHLDSHMECFEDGKSMIFAIAVPPLSR